MEEDGDELEVEEAVGAEAAAARPTAVRSSALGPLGPAPPRRLAAADVLGFKLIVAEREEEAEAAAAARRLASSDSRCRARLACVGRWWGEWVRGRTCQVLSRPFSTTCGCAF